MRRPLLVSLVLVVVLVASCSTATETATETGAGVAVPTAIATVAEVTATPAAVATATAEPPAVRPTAVLAPSTIALPEERFCWHPDDKGRRLFGDFDGDGLDEVVFINETVEGTELDMCEFSNLAIMNAIVGSPNKPGTVHVVDVEQDGIDEVLVGGPTGAAPFAGGLWRVVDGAWRSDDLGVVVRPPSDGVGETFACMDTDGDGTTELTPITYRLDDGQLNWQGSGLAGTFDRATQAMDTWLFTSGTCGNVVTTPLGSTPVTALLATVGTTSAPQGLVDATEFVGLGLHDQIFVERTGAELTAIEGWVIDAESYAQAAGPFSALDVLHRAEAVVVTVGPHSHCAGPPLDAPSGYETMTRVSIQPRGPSGCIPWFSVDLFLDASIKLHAVTLEMFGP